MLSRDNNDEMRPAKLEYASLNGPDSSPSRACRYCGNVLHYWREAAIVVLCILCAFLTLEQSIQPIGPKERAPVHDYKLISDDLRWKQFDWYSGLYSSENPQDDESVDAAWDAIVPAHGIVAVDHEWATQRNLPDTMDLPSDHSKGVYIIDSYHQIHCLTIIRKTLMQIAAGEKPSKPVMHSRHCFDSLLQYIMCGTQGDTLLYTWGRNTTGAGQLRKCIDWESRRTWAQENTACYKDTETPVMLKDHFGDCKSAETDGLVNGDWSS